MMTSTQVIEMSVNATLNSPSQGLHLLMHPDDRTSLSYDNDSWVQTINIIAGTSIKLNILKLQSKKSTQNKNIFLFNKMCYTVFFHVVVCPNKSFANYVS